MLSADAIVNIGGALIVNSSKTPAVILSSEFMSNRAQESGGAVFVSRGAQLHIEGSSFYNNNATVEGGGAHFEVLAHVRIMHSQFQANSAGMFGGAVSFQESVGGLSSTDLIQEQCSFFDNNAGSAGGAVYWHDGSPNQFRSCSSCTYDGNTVGVGGYGPSQASDVSTIAAPSNIQSILYPGVRTDNHSFRIHVVDAFGQRVTTSSGSGVQSIMSG